MCEYMFPLKNQPLIIYNYDDCESDENDMITKPLEKIYKDKRIKGNINEKNTFVLDDRTDTFSLNKRNGIQIPEFESDMSVEDICNHPDVEFLKLMSWLSTKEVRESDDVRKLNKKNIFSRSLKEYREILREELQNKKKTEEKKVEVKVEERPKTARSKKKTEEKKVEEKVEERPKTARGKKKVEEKVEERPKTARGKKKVEEKPKATKSKKDEKPTTKKKRSVKFKK